MQCGRKPSPLDLAVVKARQVMSSTSFCIVHIYFIVLQNSTKECTTCLAFTIRQFRRRRLSVRPHCSLRSSNLSSSRFNELVRSHHGDIIGVCVCVCVYVCVSPPLTFLRPVRYVNGLGTGAGYDIHRRISIRVPLIRLLCALTVSST